jgi:hypothetical protein
MFDQHPSDACEATGHLFRNADWRVLDDGLEHCATGYFIARETIAMRRGEFWEWPLHLAEKSWCTPRSFRQAFLMAVQAFGAIADESLVRTRRGIQREGSGGRHRGFRGPRRYRSSEARGAGLRTQAQRRERGAHRHAPLRHIPAAAGGGCYPAARCALRRLPDPGVVI